MPEARGVFGNKVLGLAVPAAIILGSVGVADACDAWFHYGRGAVLDVDGGDVQLGWFVVPEFCNNTPRQYWIAYANGTGRSFVAAASYLGGIGPCTMNDCGQGIPANGPMRLRDEAGSVDLHGHAQSNPIGKYSTWELAGEIFGSYGLFVGKNAPPNV